MLTHETTSGDQSADPKDETNDKIAVKTPDSLQRRVPDYKHHQRTMTSGLLLMEDDCPSAIMDESPIPNQSMLIIDHESIKKNKKAQESEIDIPSRPDVTTGRNLTMNSTWEKFNDHREALQKVR